MKLQKEQNFAVTGHVQIPQLQRAVPRGAAPIRRPATGKFDEEENRNKTATFSELLE